MELPNIDPIGNAEIIGNLQEDQILTVDTSNISDDDGLGSEGFSYQWLADGQIISEATNDNFILTQNEVGKEISVSVSYTDDFGTFETVTSDATAEVGNVNDTPVGVPEVL